MTMTHPLIMTPPYSMKIFSVKTFASCPETAKVAKVFTRERFPLYGITGNFHEHNHTTNAFKHFCMNTGTINNTAKNRHTRVITVQFELFCSQRNSDNTFKTKV